MKIFLDCGAWLGVSVDFFRKFYPKANEFKIYSFECLPENYIELICSIEKFNRLYEYKYINVIQEAVWIENCKKKFYVGLSESGSLNENKKTGGVNPDNFITVNCIDIAEFIETHFTKNDYIVMKLNIEGAEYDVIQHLYNKNLINWVDKWHIEWHWTKIGMPIKEHLRISSLIPNNYLWPAMFDVNSKRFKDEFKDFEKLWK